MQFSENSRVYTAQDENLGKIDRIVIDPVAGEVTHLVVRKGILLPEDKVVPVDDVATATEVRVNLRAGVNPNDYQPFEETHYVPLTPDVHMTPTTQIAAAPGISPVAWYGPLGGVNPSLETYSKTVATRNIPERAVALEPGSPVRDRTTRQIGTVTEVITADNGRATHLVVDHDAPDPDRAVPITFVERIGETGVHLGVNEAIVSALPPLDPETLAGQGRELREPSPVKTTAIEPSMQSLLTKLVDLTLQVQHIRWNLPDEETALRRQLDDFDALIRAGSDEIARRIRQSGKTPDGRVYALAVDAGFPPLTTGPFEKTAAVKEFVTRLAQLAAEIRDTVEVADESDAESAAVLRSFSEELLTWTNGFESPA